MDEHIIINKGKTITFKNCFCDHNLKNLSFFINKHDWYANREAVDILLSELNKKKCVNLNSKNTSFHASLKRYMKENIYNNLPIGVRPFSYFVYRYFILLGFLDGKEGLIYHFLQGFWYRFLVDSKLVEFRKELKRLDNNDDYISKLSMISNLDINIK